MTACRVFGVQMWSGRMVVLNLFSFRQNVNQLGEAIPRKFERKISMERLLGYLKVAMLVATLVVLSVAVSPHDADAIQSINCPDVGDDCMICPPNVTCFQKKKKG